MRLRLSLGKHLPAFLAGAALALAGQALAGETLSSHKGEQLRAEARSFEHGEGVAKDVNQAIKLYCEAARLGDGEAQYSIGWIFANARGVTRDDEQAAYFFRLAADQGHPHAQRMLRYFAEMTGKKPECMIDPEPPEDLDGREIVAAASPDARKVYELVARLAPQYGIYPRLALAVIRVESNFNPAAVSPKNAQGLMQLIPETSARFNVKRPFDPEDNIRGGLAYLRWLLAYFRGDVALVAAAYNAGEGAVNRYRGVPPYEETRGYVKRVVEFFRRDAHPFDATVTEPSPELHRIRSTKLM